FLDGPLAAENIEQGIKARLQAFRKQRMVFPPFEQVDVQVAQAASRLRQRRKHGFQLVAEGSVVDAFEEAQHRTYFSQLDAVIVQEFGVVVGDDAELVFTRHRNTT